jgi:adenosylcobinamide-GDP ribazoletransferase
VVGLVTLLLLWALPHGIYAPLVVAVLGTVASVWMTGAFHEDGLADVVDGLGGSPDRQRALEIMKDSRVGAFGAVALMLALMTKVALLALVGSLSVPLMVAGIFLAHVASRTWPLCVIWLLPHVGDDAGSKSKPLADQITGGALCVAGLWCSGALALVLYAQAATDSIAPGLPMLHFAALLLAALAVSAVAFVWMWHWFARCLQGFTGDCLGAMQQVCELAFYLGWALAMPWVLGL